MKCAKCGAMLADKEYSKEPMGSEDMEEGSVKDSVLAELIEAMQGSVGEDLKKPAFMAIEIKKKG